MGSLGGGEAADVRVAGLADWSIWTEVGVLVEEVGDDKGDPSAKIEAGAPEDESKFLVLSHACNTKKQ